MRRHHPLAKSRSGLAKTDDAPGSQGPGKRIRIGTSGVNFAGTNFAMNFAIDAPHVLFVGGEDHNLRIPFLRAMVARGFRVSAASTGDPAPFAAAGLAHHAFRFERFVAPFADYNGLRSLRALLDRVGADIVQSFDTKPNILVPLAAAGGHCQTIRTINGMGWVYSSRSPLAMALRPVQLVLHRRAAAHVAATVFQNRDDQALFERHHLLGAGSSVLIQGSGVDIDGMDAALACAPSREAMRASLGLGDAPVVITVTRLTRQKGIPALLRAAALVHRVRPEIRFVLVGPIESEGPFAVTREEIEPHGAYVTALGRRNDVAALLRAADLFAFPTEYREGVPRALMEAALAGLPLAATAMPGCSDVVEDGVTGRLVPPRDPRRLADAILAMLADGDGSAAMARRARQHVRAGFGLDNVADRYAALYRSVLGRTVLGQPDATPAPVTLAEPTEASAP